MEQREYYLNLIPKPPKLGYVIAILLSIFLLSLSFNYGIDAYKIYKSLKTEQQTITISAEGKITASPDLADFDISVITEGKDPKKVEEENTKKTNLIVDFIKSKSVDSKDIKTTNYSLSPQYYYPLRDNPQIPPKPPVIIGYKLNQTINLKIRNFKIIGDVLSEVIEKGANSISDLQFSIEDPDNLKNEARKIAINKAKEKAQELAQTAGVKLGKVVSFSEGSVYFPQSRLYKTLSLSAGGESASPQIESGSQEVSVTMNVVFEIK